MCSNRRPYTKGSFVVDYTYLAVYNKVNSNGKKDIRSSKDVYLEELLAGFELDERLSCRNLTWAKETFAQSFALEFNNFRAKQEWLSLTKQAILVNDAFYVAMEDNAWGFAVELVNRQAACEEQQRLYKKYLAGIKHILLNMFGEVDECIDSHCTHKVRIEKRTKFYD